ncbi:MAG: hypothetical protein RLZZ141_1474, partial [Pseudomonadota bacterium]
PPFEDDDLDQGEWADERDDDPDDVPWKP